MLRTKSKFSTSFQLLTDCLSEVVHESALSFFASHVQMESVTPRSSGYGDITATYIRMSEIPSRIYAKHQYMHESEYGSTAVIYIPTEKYKYMIITEIDTIL